MPEVELECWAVVDQDWKISGHLEWKKEVADRRASNMNSYTTAKGVPYSVVFGTFTFDVPPRVAEGRK